MPNEKRRKRDRERRRNEIIDAAERLFFSKGYDVITMDDIAADAGLARALGHIFQKKSLFYAVALRGVRLLNTLFAGAVKGEKVGVDKIYSTGVAYDESQNITPSILSCSPMPSRKGSSAGTMKTLSSSRK